MISIIIVLLSGIVYINFFYIGKYKKLIQPLLILSILIISARLFFFDLYIVPSRSMNDTLIPGDIIIIKKTNSIFFPNVPIIKNIGIMVKPQRFETKENDIVVFNLKSEYFVKRCVGVAGDTLQLKKSVLYINDKRKAKIETLKNYYKIYFNSYSHLVKNCAKFNINIYQEGYKKTSRFVTSIINENQMKKLVDVSCIDSIILNQVDSNHKSNSNIFPNSNFFSWSLNDFGPVLIPYFGYTLKLNKESYTIYNKTISKYEGVIINCVGNRYYVKNKEILEYRFQNDYCFMLGDNRANSIDSRYFGFVPEKNIQGKVLMVLFSNYNKFKWNRFFKLV